MGNVLTVNKCLQNTGDVLSIFMFHSYRIWMTFLYEKKSLFLFGLCSNCTRVVVLFSLFSFWILRFHRSTSFWMSTSVYVFFTELIFPYLYKMNRCTNVVRRHAIYTIEILNWTDSSSKLLLTIQRLYCVRFNCIDDLELDYYQSMWHFRHITTSVVLGGFLYSIEFHIFMQSVIFGK